MRLLIVLTALYASVAWACPIVHISSSVLPFINDDYVVGFYQTDDDAGDPLYHLNGRPIYVSQSEPPRYLFSLQVGDDMGGRWLIGGEPGQNSAWAFVQSWAVAPHLIPVVSDRASWRVFMLDDAGEGSWVEDIHLTVECKGTDTSVFLSSSRAPSLTGLYVETAKVEADRSVFISDDLFLYSSGCCTWIVGEVPGDGSGLAYVEAEVDHPEQIPQAILDRDWNVAIDGGWVSDEQFLVMGSDNQNCVEALLRQKEGGNETKANPPTSYVSNLESIHATCGQRETTFQIVQMLRTARKPTEHTAELWNGVPMPLVGAGTGAMVRAECADAIALALDVGYRLLDTATAYDNEDIIGDLLAARGDRDSIFLLSKLWYSELGFSETLAAVDRSLQRLRTSYLDGYLIHWPQCYPEVEWMDCEQATEGTWQQSWRALEKLYAEGKLLSIGVSNYHTSLFQDLLDFASTTPHIVQNFHDVVTQDVEVLDLAQSYGVQYQAYSSLRTFLSPETRGPEYDKARQQIQEVADRLHVTPAQALLRWQVQQGIAVIPRSQKREHAVANLDVFGFELSRDDMDLLTADQSMSQHHWDLHDEL